MDEQKLIELAQQGGLESFNQLVLVYQEMVFNTAYRILGDDASAEDAAQVTFINAYRNIKQYRGGSFKAWLLRTVTNACYDELRRQKRRPTTPLEPVSQDNDEELDSPGWMEDNSPSPEEALENKEIERAVQNCIQALPDEFRTVVILVDIQGLDYSEASSAVGKPLGTVKSRLARARLRLRDCLKGLMELLPANHRLISESER
ncbi:MAG: sigma-70 family RNA polymerase sigma factor [Anaerolineae bacterium]|nr:sigma-70 family RNA polymerase sigma factor [Anaerolineae bacterium]